MLFNFEHTIANIVTNSIFYVYLIFVVLLLFPLKSKIGNYNWTRYIPIVSIIFYIIYESVIPTRWDIRFDLVFIWPLLIIILTLGTFRFFRNRKQSV